MSPNPNQPGSYYLTNANGGYLLDQNSQPIVLDSEYDVTINSSGQILLKNGEEPQFTNGQRVGLVDIQNPHLL
ncbi:hypothetical protein RYX45_20720, partial [Alkalihalophilus pseudofirmus]|nr:hypothetical protein [Alkalihalophilus pseudofirmus]